MSGDSTTTRRGRPAVRQALGAATATVFAAASLVLAAGLAAEPAAADLAAPASRVEPVVIVPDPAAAPEIRTAAARPERVETERVETERGTTTSASDEDRAEDEDSPADDERGCGAAAVASGSFDASCDEYQGYLDPGESAGRGATSGESQFAYGCEQGYIPESECG